jgi:hypothetical protein
MPEAVDYLVRTVLIRVGATAVVDARSIAPKYLLGIASLDYGLVGRWFAHMARRRFRHDTIAAAVPVRGERFIGRTAHYLSGIAFAFVLLAIWGIDGVRHLTIGPALIVGIGSVNAPFLLMQPGMGAGIAASRTAHPAVARINNLVAHCIFGLGLYLAGWAVSLSIVRP